MAIVRNIQNQTFYRYLGNNIYRNLITGIEGVIDEEMAAKIFVINLDATEMFSEHPMIEKLIKTLKLRSDGILSVQEK